MHRGYQSCVCPVIFDDNGLGGCRVRLLRLVCSLSSGIGWLSTSTWGCWLSSLLGVTSSVGGVAGCISVFRSSFVSVDGVDGVGGCRGPVGSLSFGDIWGRSFSRISDFARWLVNFHLPQCDTVYVARLVLQSQCCSTSSVCFHTGFEFVRNLQPAMGVVLSVLVVVLSVLSVSLLVLPLFCQLSPAMPAIVWGWVLVGDIWLVFQRVRQRAKFGFADMVNFAGPWVPWRLCHCPAFQFMGHYFQEECVWLFSRWLLLSHCFEGNKLRRACVKCSIFSIDWYNPQSRMGVFRRYQFFPVRWKLQNTSIASLWQRGNLCWSS